MTASRKDRLPELRLPLLLVLFFGSGATGLLYEILWMRRLALVFGGTQMAVSLVLGTFMLGLAGGSLLGGRLADRGRYLLILYGALEIFLGLFALCFPHLLDLLTGWYVAPGGGAVAQWQVRAQHSVLLGLLLLPPTLAMGATFPVLVRFAAGQLSRVGSRTGLLYGVNTAGAVFGTWATGFVLLPMLGLRTTELAAAATNGAIGVIAGLWGLRWAHTALPVDDRAERSDERLLRELPDDPDQRADLRGRQRRSLPWILAVSGACALAWEVAWTRFLTLILGSSVYAFSLMLVAFLLGTAGGGLLASWSLDRPGARPLRILGLALCVAALWAALGLALFPLFPFFYVDLYSLVGGHDSLVFAVQGFLAVGVMTPASLALGMALPLAVGWTSDRPERVGREVARLLASNTLGAVLGALGTGFFLVPLMGIQKAVLATCVLCLVAAAAVLEIRSLASRRRRVQQALLAGSAAAIVLLRPAWDPLLMSAGMYQYVSDLSEFSHEAVRNYALSDYEVLYYAEGATSVVTVARSLGSDNIWLANNGKVDASTTDDLRTQILLAHLPAVFRPKMEDVLVVGLASGITAGSVTLHEGLRKMDVLEIEPAVVEASHYFDAHNYRPLEDPRVRSITNDARNHLVRNPRRYDVIINEPSNPWITGVSNLFTLEFLQLGRARLRTGGLFVQWVQTYGMGKDDLRSLIRTFCEVYPYAVAVTTLEDADLLLVGSEGPLVPWPGRIQDLLNHPRIGPDLGRIGVREPYDLLSFVLTDRGGLLRLAEDAELNTDDNARIEFSAPLYLHYATQEINARLLMTADDGPWPLFSERVNEPEKRAEFLEHLGDAYVRWDRPKAALRSFQTAWGFVPEREGLDDRMLRASEALEAGSEAGAGP